MENARIRERSSARTRRSVIRTELRARNARRRSSWNTFTKKLRITRGGWRDFLRPPSRTRRTTASSRRVIRNEPHVITFMIRRDKSISRTTLPAMNATRTSISDKKEPPSYEGGGVPAEEGLLRDGMHVAGETDHPVRQFGFFSAHQGAAPGFFFHQALCPDGADGGENSSSHVGPLSYWFD